MSEPAKDEAELIERMAEGLHNDYDQNLPEKYRGSFRTVRPPESCDIIVGSVTAVLAAIRAAGWAVVPVGGMVCEAEAERDEIFNRLGRVTSELGLSMDVTASRIIEAIRDQVDEEREACASVTVRIEVPDGAETWSPLEAFEEGLLLSDEAFRNAIRSRAMLAAATGVKP
jgi:hypothetical protein